MLFYFLVFIFGLCLGSFLNVVICRLDTKEPIFFGRSHCPKCKAVLRWVDLIPILSFVLQKGKCRYCRKKISWQYPLVEISTGLVFLLFYINSLNFLYYLVIGCFLIVIFVYDLKHYIIPDKIVYPAIIIAFSRNLFVEGMNLSKIGNFLLSAFLAAGFFLLLVLVSRGKWMGLGDVKLAFLMGLVLGWPNILLALVLSFFSGAVIGIILMLLGKKGLKSEIPFGPFLVSATILIMLWANKVTDILYIFVDNYSL